jgi:16S rRNA (guanine1516-N2)-methyltransferase
MNLQQHLVHLGLDVDSITKHLPKGLTLSFEDGVLFVCDNNHQRVHVDFLQGPVAFRASQHTSGEHLIKACRFKNQTEVSVLDATCGMGRDSFLLFQSGFHVSATEKNPVIHALLSDGLNRYQIEKELMPFQLHHQAAEDLMVEQKFDVIYLDPMFPEKSKSAKAKKDMQLFQAIHQHHEDNAAELLTKALRSDAKRVVIKRPLRADLLLTKIPTFQIKGKICRFDAYQIS